MDSQVIKFEDFFKVINSDKTKIKFNMNPGDRSLHAWDYLRDDNPEWLNMNNHRNIKSKSNNLDKVEFLLAFAQYYPYGPEYFIFGGMYKVEKIIPEVNNGTGYKLTLLDDYKCYIKRLIIKLEKPIGWYIYCRWYNNLQQSEWAPTIYEILPIKQLEKFPGYNNFILTHKQLQSIWKREEYEWKDALSKVKGVYCITDTSNGQLYIGSATGDNEGIWQRWQNYANVNDLTGGNKAFNEIKRNGAGHIIDNFTYSILEIFDMRTNSDYIIKREHYWMNVFKSVKYGMNNTR